MMFVPDVFLTFQLFSAIFDPYGPTPPCAKKLILLTILLFEMVLFSASQ